MCVCLLSCSFTHTPLAFCLSCFFFLLYNVSVKLIHIISILYFFNTYCISVMLKYHVFFCLFISFKLCILKGRRRRRRKNKRVVSIYLPFILLSIWSLLWNDVFCFLPFVFLLLPSSFLCLVFFFLLLLFSW